jgi:hypothetical protein
LFIMQMMKTSNKKNSSARSNTIFLFIGGVHTRAVHNTAAQRKRTARAVKHLRALNTDKLARTQKLFPGIQLQHGLRMLGISGIRNAANKVSLAIVVLAPPAPRKQAPARRVRRAHLPSIRKLSTCTSANYSCCFLRGRARSCCCFPWRRAELRE